MPLDHYLPATFLASFSPNICQPRRESVLAVGNVLKRKIFSAKAENLAVQHDFYSLKQQVFWAIGKQPNLRLIDETWLKYEGDLAHSIAALIAGEITALAWARTLVPFAASMLVRGPDFNSRFENRPVVRHIMGSVPITPDNTNGARIIELQRLLGPIAAAQWVVSFVTGNEKLVTNDVGFARVQDGNTGDVGIAIPIDLKHVLKILPRKSGVVATIKDGIWCPKIGYESLDAGNESGLNNIMASGAQRFVFGGDEQAIVGLLAKLPPNHLPFPPIEPAQAGFLSGTDASVHHFTWHRLISFLMKLPNTDSPESFDLDWDEIAQGWCPPVALSLNRPIFPSALHRIGDKVIVDFYDGKWALNQAGCS